MSVVSMKVPAPIIGAQISETASVRYRALRATDQRSEFVFLRSISIMVDAGIRYISGTQILTPGKVSGTIKFKLEVVVAVNCMPGIVPQFVDVAVPVLNGAAACIRLIAFA